ncbi:MFS transporter [Tunturiibacter lichenicola]|uniref:MFS transporter n=1 Tax=Tunturiibacter lichenicola TaxID=2051959 RepID=UPI003D9B8DF9
MSEAPQENASGRIYNPYLGIAGVLLGAALATFLGRLLSVGIADLRGALHLDFDAASWIGTSYNMGLMFIGPFSVYLGGLLGPRRVLLACAAIFSVLCAFMPFATHYSLLITLLVLAGLAAGTFYPLSLSFILRNIPQRYALYGIAAYAVDIVVSTHIAHSYEGWFMTSLSWRWIFWTDACLTPLMMIFVYLGIAPQPLPQPKPGQPTPSWRGFLYFSLGAAMVFGALDQGQRLDWWSSRTFVALFVTGIFLVVCAAVRHFLLPNPLINFPFIRRRNPLLMAFVLVFFRFMLLSAVVVVPSYLASVQSYNNQEVGPVLLWLAIPQIFAGLFAVYLLGRIDNRIILGSGFALMGLGCLMNASLSSAWSGTNFMTSQLVLALGEGLAFNGLVGSLILDILNSGAMSRGIDLLTFSGFFQTIRLLGGEIGSTFMQHFLQTREQFHSNIVGLHVQAGSPATNERIAGLTAAMGAQASTHDVALGRASDLLALTVRKQAFTLAITDCFLLLACASVACLVIISFLEPLKVQYKQLLASLKAQRA